MRGRIKGAPEMLNLRGTARQRVSARIDLHPRGTCIICALGFCPIDRESRFSTLPSHQKLIAHNRKFLWRAIPPHEPLLAHPHSDSFSTAPAPLLLQAACKQLCRKLSFHLPTRSELPDNVSSNTCIQPCTDTVERTCFAFCGSRRVSWLVGKKLDWWPPLRTTLSLTCCKSKKCATCARRKYGRPSSASLCRPCRSKSPAWATPCSKRPLSLPDTGWPSATMASCSSPLPDNSF